MSLLTIPNELFLHISTFLDKDRDFKALIKANRRLYQLLISRLYHNNIHN